MHGCNGSTNEGPNPKDPLVILGLFIVVDDNNFQIRGIAFSTSHQKIPLKARAFFFSDLETLSGSMPNPMHLCSTLSMFSSWQTSKWNLQTTFVNDNPDFQILYQAMHGGCRDGEPFLCLIMRQLDFLRFLWV